MKYDWIFVVGEDGVGKSTFAAALGEALGLQVGETSRVLDGPTARIAAEVIDAQVQEVVDAMACRKDQWRASKRAVGDAMCEFDAAALMKRCAAQGAKIIVGMRRTSEVLTFCEWCGTQRALLIPIVKDGADLASEWLSLPIATLENAPIGNDGSRKNLVAMAVKVAETIR